MFDDIPEATREPIKTPASSAKFPVFWLLGSGILIVAIAISSIWLLNRYNNSVSEPPQAIPTAETISPESTVSISEPVIETLKPSQQDIENVLGHLPYEEASSSDLVPITRDGSILLHRTAAQKFRQMEADAKAQGINLAIISGFRSVETQNYLFFNIKERRVQDTAKRAEVSAPPGYSEHHTGYAVDLGDARSPATNLQQSFENTAAFQWLDQNAAKYSFELSFPRDNAQGISYEPWHWRFVGDRESLETFYKAKNIK